MRLRTLPSRLLAAAVSSPTKLITIVLGGGNDRSRSDSGGAALSQPSTLEAMLIFALMLPAILTMAFFRLIREEGRHPSSSLRNHTASTASLTGTHSKHADSTTTTDSMSDQASAEETISSLRKELHVARREALIYKDEARHSAQRARQEQLAGILATQKHVASQSDDARAQTNDV